MTSRRQFIKTLIFTAGAVGIPFAQGRPERGCCAVCGARLTGLDAGVLTKYARCDRHALGDGSLFNPKHDLRGAYLDAQITGAYEHGQFSVRFPSDLKDWL